MIRHIAVVMRGMVLAQAVGFAALPFLTRLFPPESFGHYQLFVSIMTLLLVFATLRYEIALLRSNEPAETRALLQLSIMCCVGVAVLVGAIGYALLGIGWPKALSNAPFPMWLLTVGFAFGGFAQFLTIMATREEQYARNSNSKVLQSLGYAVVGLSLGAAGFFVDTGLVVADTVGRLLAATYLWIWLRRTVPNLFDMDIAKLWEVARKYREYPLISVPGTVVNVLGGIATPVMMYATFSAAVSGQYALFERGVNLPISLIVIATAQVFTAQFSSLLRSDPAQAMLHFQRTLTYMSGLALVILAGALLLAPLVVSILFGPEWQQAGRFAQAMAPALASAILSGPINMVLTVMGHQKTQTVWEIARLGLVCALWLTVPIIGLAPMQAIITYGLILCACNLAFVATAYVMIKRRRDRPRDMVGAEIQ